MYKLTEKQVTWLEKQFEEIRTVHKVESGPRYIWDVHIHHEDEVRPGRGHTIFWYWGNGENVIQGHMDVYGSGEYAIADVEWTHNGFDDECKCSPCKKYRQEEDN